MSQDKAQDEFEILEKQEREAKELFIKTALNYQQERLKIYSDGGTVGEILTTLDDRFIIGRAVGPDIKRLSDKRIIITNINDTTISTSAFTITRHSHPNLGEGINIWVNPNQTVWIGNQRKIWDAQFPFFIQNGDCIDVEILVGHEGVIYNEKGNPVIIRKLHRFSIYAVKGQQGEVQVYVRSLNPRIR